MLVSIIIPAYNASKYINECLESIVSQTLESLEIIIVDDGSTDDTPDICDDWASRDGRISVIHVDNCGPASSRNAGLSKSNGEWVWFVDADDVVEYNAAEILLDDAIRHKPDVVIMDIRPFGPEGNLPRSVVAKKSFPNLGMASGRQLIEMYAESRIESFVWSMFFKASFLKSFSGTGNPFVEGCRLFEDMAFMWQVAAMEPTVYFEDKRLYGYRQSSGSLVHKVNLRNATSGYDALRIVNELSVPAEVGRRKNAKVLSCLLMIDGQAGVAAESADLHRKVRADVLRIWQSLGIRECSLATNARCVLIMLGVYARVRLLVSDLRDKCMGGLR